jgi:hypothetical protein
MSSPRNIKIVRLSCNGEWENGMPFVQTLTKLSTDPIFQEKSNCPVGSIINLPLVIKKLHYNSSSRADYQNQWATYIKLDPSHGGFASLDWQDYVGPVYIFRPGGRLDFTDEDLEIFHDFCYRLLGEWGEDDFNSKREITAKKYVNNAINYKRNAPECFQPENVATIDFKNKCIREDKACNLPKKVFAEGVNLDEKFCFTCLKQKDVKLLMCGGCKKFSYCSKDCQKADWSAGHKTLCKDIATFSVDVRAIHEKRVVQLGMENQVDNLKKQPGAKVIE